MKILNLHGFMGEADNKNYKALCKIVPAESIISPKLHYKGNSPQEILDMLSVQLYLRGTEPGRLVCGSIEP